MKFFEKKQSVKKVTVPSGKFASDSFVCDTCGLRMLLKIYGDTTSCRKSGCSGTMHRV